MAENKQSKPQIAGRPTGKQDKKINRIKINGSRLLGDLRHLSTYTDTPGVGVTRFSYGLMDQKAREYIGSIADTFGCTYETDGVGNIRIGLLGNRPGRKTILAGSHIDTVQNGGWLDGVYGSMAALEVLRTLAESGQQFDKNYEVVIFAEEEGSNFDSTLTGSKFATGFYGKDQWTGLKNHQGASLGEMISTGNSSNLIKWRNPSNGSNPSNRDNPMGGDPHSNTKAKNLDLAGLPWDFSNIEAMVEMHIEQGPVLEREGLELGILDSIFGMRLVEFELSGVGNHAGASPMAGRRDALTAAAACILLVEKIAAKDPGHETVATAGKLFVFPNATNVIPEKVIFTVEVRDRDDKKIHDTTEEIIQAVREEADKRNVSMSFREVATNKAVRLSDAMVKRMTELADVRGMDFQVMGSGAVHDASMLAQYVNTGMIFVPSIGGRSHVKEEDTKEKTLIAGADFLATVILDLL